MTTQKNTPATGSHTTNGTPHGYSSITPFLAVADPTAALAFYQEVFGAQLISAFRFGEVVVHAELQFSDGRLQLGAAQPDYHLVAPDADGDDVTYSLALYCPNVDDVVARAVAHGATVREETTNFISGDRFASVRDPFGVRWSVMTRVEDLSDEESQKRVEEWSAGMG